MIVKMNRYLKGGLMTRNQIEYAKLKENIRHNIETEGLNAKNLAEVMANNLRQYRVNTSRLQLDKLANDQLNDRERAKLAESIRNNLAKELETNRHNLNDEDIRRATNAINSLKSKYQAGPLIAAILGLMSDDDMRHIYGDALPRAKKQLEQNSSNVFDEISYLWQAVGRTDLNQSKRKRNDVVEGIKRTHHAFIQQGRDVDEIPTDKSNSAGPGLVTKSMMANKLKREQGISMYDAPIGPTKPTSANNNAISLPDAQGNVIYHPSVKKENVGPGLLVPGAN